MALSRYARPELVEGSCLVRYYPSASVRTGHRTSTEFAIILSVARRDGPSTVALCNKVFEEGIAAFLLGVLGSDGEGRDGDVVLTVVDAE